MRVSIINAWGENRGDEAMLRALTSHIFHMCQDAQIGIYSYGPVDLPPNILQYTNRDLPMAGLTAFLANPGLSTARTLLRDTLGYSDKQQRAGKDFFKSTDLVISGPAGPYIGDTYADLNRACLARIRIADLLGKPCIITATSAGGFSRSWRNTIRRAMLKRVKWWTLREELSYEAVKTLKLPNTEIQMSADIVFSRNVNNANADINEAERAELQSIEKYTTTPTIGVIITTTPYIDASGTVYSFDQPTYVQAMATFLATVVHRTGCQILFFPHHYGTLHEMRILRAIIGLLDGQARCRVFPPQLNSDCQQLAMRGLLAVISQRYHPSIFGMQQEVPVFCIVHQFKSAGLLKLFNYSIPMPTTLSSVDEWRLTFDLFWQCRQDLKAQIVRELPRVRDLACLTVTKLARDLEQCRVARPNKVGVVSSGHKVAGCIRS